MINQEFVVRNVLKPFHLEIAQTCQGKKNILLIMYVPFVLLTQMVSLLQTIQQNSAISILSSNTPCTISLTLLLAISKAFLTLT